MMNIGSSTSDQTSALLLADGPVLCGGRCMECWSRRSVPCLVSRRGALQNTSAYVEQGSFFAIRYRVTDVLLNPLLFARLRFREPLARALFLNAWPSDSTRQSFQNRCLNRTVSRCKRLVVHSVSCQSQGTGPVCQLSAWRALP